MAREHLSGVNLPPTVNPREFIEKQSIETEVGVLGASPDLDLLRYLPSAVNPAGLVLQDNVWYVVRGGPMGVPAWAMPNSASVLLHTHNNGGKDEEFDPLPDTRDLINGSSTARNLIASPAGITQFWRINDEATLKRVGYDVFRRFDTKAEYLQFLEEIGARHEFNKWEDIDEKELSRLLDPQLR